ncbi:MAG TPA: hypothetical protein VKC60_15930 [Opitutaceae bacterium]|nr:hypothetical protein [Opitutaceae bacterium]
MHCFGLRVSVPAVVQRFDLYLTAACELTILNVLLKALISTKDQSVEVEFRGGIDKKKNLESALAAFAEKIGLEPKDVLELKPKVEFLKAEGKAAKSVKNEKQELKAAAKPKIHYLKYSPGEPRPKPPSPNELPAGTGWIRRSTADVYSEAMPEELRPNGKGRIVPEAEAKLCAGVNWDVVSAAGTTYEGLFTPANR